MKVTKNCLSKFLLTLLLCISKFNFANATSNYPIDALVDKQNQSAFQSIQAAIDSAPLNLSKPYRIQIAAGDYYEKLTIDKPFIRLIGAGDELTRIHYDDYAGKKGANGKSIGTTGSATITVSANNFSARHLHIENSFNFPHYEGLDINDPERVSGMQAVALKLAQGSDNALFFDVKFSGYQDTLYTHAGRALFVNCTVQGHIDFIFGGGTAIFFKSNIVTRARQTDNLPIGYITAPSTNVNNPFGLVFIKSALSREPDVEDNSMGLGRPWHPTTTFPDGRYADPNAIGQTVFIDTWMGQHIQSSPWHPMGGTAKNGDKILFQPEDSRFYELGSWGPGAEENAHRRQLSEQARKTFTWGNMLGDWYESNDEVKELINTAQTLAFFPDQVGPFSSYKIANEYNKHKDAFPFIEPVSSTITNSQLSAELNLEYKKTKVQPLLLDLVRTKDNVQKPVVIMLHGGAWRFGDKSHHLETAQWLAEHGYVGVTMQYTLSNKGLYPQALEDLSDAINWLKQHHKEYAIDPNKIAVLGTSSSGHMVNFYGALTAHPKINSAYAPVDAIINIDGVVDMASPESRVFEDKVGKTSYAGLWLGGRYRQEPARWHAASATEYLGEHVPPTLYVNSSIPRFHVGRDRFVASLTEYGIYNEVHTIENTPHTFWLFQPWANEMRQILKNFLDKVFYDQATQNTTKNSKETD
ncbi:pectinesterase family protein [Glaciecola sp. 1036]|uniref:pectinesterase family protein n=1 Tax=Alteromonadaceae TaxID=72275 RepID=UPI003D01C468